MEWYDNIGNLPQWLQANPRYGYLIAAGILVFWLTGVICGWKWTYSRPGNPGGNFWMETLGEKTFRFWLGAILAALAGIAVYLFFISEK